MLAVVPPKQEAPRMLKRSGLLAALLLVGSSSALHAQQPAAPPPTGGSAKVCGIDVAPPANLPPAGSGPVLYLMAPCFEAQGNVSLVDSQTYLYYIQLKDKM